MSKTRPTSASVASLKPEIAASLIAKQIEKGREILSNRPVTSSKVQAWEGVVHDLLIRAYGTDSPNIEKVMGVNRYAGMCSKGGEAQWEQTRVRTMETRLEILDSFASSLLDLSGVSTCQPNQSTPHNTSVFIVHGHDALILSETARTLSKLGLKEVILREQPNQGRTIIEKFEEYSNVGFAVVLLTGDDTGKANSSTEHSYMPRARQNVILELGYFIGKLGRNRVCALYEKGVEIPSDYAGVAFVPIDDGGSWRWLLAKELKEAGYAVDLGVL